MNNGYDEFFINGKHYYAHRYAAEQMLGRKLLSSEVVHHIDGNRSNNNFNNLIVFKNTSEHSKYHKAIQLGYDVELILEGDVYTVKIYYPEPIISYSIINNKRHLKESRSINRNNRNSLKEKINKSYSKEICPVCNRNYKLINSYSCKECALKRHIKNDFTQFVYSFPSEAREELMVKVLNNSFCSIGRQFGVSDNMVRKWCKKLDIPSTKKEINNFYKEKKIPFKFVNN